MSAENIDKNEDKSEKKGAHEYGFFETIVQLIEDAALSFKTKTT